MQIVLAGNPNAGKTTLFNFLTKSHLKTGNWHGVTTTSASKSVGGVTYIDSPGLYSFDSYSMEESEAVNSIKQADLIVNVVDSLTLKNSLNLTKKLIYLNKNVVVYLTKVKQLKARGGSVNADKLEKYLGVPVYDCPQGELKRLVSKNALLRPVERGDVALDEAYYGGNCNLNRAEKLFYNKFFASAFFVFAMTCVFFLTFHPLMPGAQLKELVEDLLCVKLSGVLSGALSNAAASSLVCDGLIGGVGGVLSFIPQLAILYLALILLDESGVMSALSFVTDGVFEKVKLSGRAAFSLITGFGCTAAAISTTRAYASKSSQLRTIAILPCIPCGAKLPVFLTFLSPVFSNPFPAVCVLYFSGIALAILLSMLLKGDAEGLISEIAPISLPRINAVKNKLSFQLKSFIIKVTTYVAVFCVVSWVLSHFDFAFRYVEVEGSILCALSRLVLPLFYPMGVTDWRLAYAFVTGFAAKENVAATVALLMPNGTGLSFASSIASCAFMLTCPACISAFAASVKEIGFKSTLICNILQLIFALLFAYLIYFILGVL